MGDIYKKWVDFGIDGFRIDTVKHVNIEFWQKFVPDILAEAKKVKNDDFFAFGEVYDGNPAVMSQYTTEGKLQATLDFGFQQQGVDFAKGKPASVLADFFSKDDWYTDADSNAYQLPTFLGNHDMGRASMFLKADGQSEAEHLKRVKFADSLMFTSRGNPVTYYGDEQGFVSTGGDQAAREDMFASKVDLYNTEDVLGGPEGSRDRYNTKHPLYRHIAELSELRAENPALADGAQINRFAADGAGIFATSRIGAGTKGGKNDGQVEYVVAANNDTKAATATFPTWTKGKGAVFTPVYGTDTAVKPAADGSVKVTVPPLTVSVWKANKPISTTGAAPTVETVLADGGAYGRTEVKADVQASTFAQTTFLWRKVGETKWQNLGTDDNAPFRVFHDVSGIPLATPLEYRAIVKDAAGRVAGDSSTTQVVKPPTQTVPELGDPPATQPERRRRSPGRTTPRWAARRARRQWDWAPDCDAGPDGPRRQRPDLEEDVHACRPGRTPTRPRINKSWTENYGDGGVLDGPNISYETDGTVTFYYDHATHWATSDEEGADHHGARLVPERARLLRRLGPRLHAPVAAGQGRRRRLRPRHHEDPGGHVRVQGRARAVLRRELRPAGNLSVTVPKDGARTTFLYDKATHEVTVTSELSR